MNHDFLSKVFEERSGFVYKYDGSMLKDSEITSQLKDTLGSENFVSRIVRINNNTLVYCNVLLPGETNFYFSFLYDLTPLPYVEPPVIQFDQSSNESDTLEQ